MLERGTRKGGEERKERKPAAEITMQCAALENPRDGDVGFATFDPPHPPKMSQSVGNVR